MLFLSDLSLCFGNHPSVGAGPSGVGFAEFLFCFRQERLSFTVNSGMFAERHELQIIQSVVLFISVDVVDNFLPFQLPSQVLFHHDSVDIALYAVLFLAAVVDFFAHYVYLSLSVVQLVCRAVQPVS